MHAALLRAVNVGGGNPIGMADLRAALAARGFADARTWLQSGNVVFDGGRRGAAALEALVESELAKRFAVRVDCMVRTAEEWKGIVARNPFPDAARTSPSRLLVYFLKDRARAGAEKSLRAASPGPERVRVAEREAYVVYPDGVGRAKLTPALLDRELGVRGTGRNWNTVLKLAALLG
jgi:uncharacterized protein (DUF1697 family)